DAYLSDGASAPGPSATAFSAGCCGAWEGCATCVCKASNCSRLSGANGGAATRASEGKPYWRSQSASAARVQRASRHPTHPPNSANWIEIKVVVAIHGNVTALLREETRNTMTSQPPSAWTSRPRKGRSKYVRPKTAKAIKRMNESPDPYSNERKAVWPT